jgi:hypothetical protein
MHPPNSSRNLLPRNAFADKRPQRSLGELQGIPVAVRVSGFAVPVVHYTTNVSEALLRLLNVLGVFGTQ